MTTQYSILRKFYVFLSTIGIEPLKFTNLRFLFKYFDNLRTFKKLGGKANSHFPILSDFHQQAGYLSRHYFKQDLHVASLVFNANPARHLDVGSRLDGFVAHVASFRKIEVMDIRPLQDMIHQNISFVQANLMLENPYLADTFDSISCLHAIEHFGLGRYNDPIIPDGYITGFNNLLKMLKVGGNLYISFPIGTSNQVQFNAQRIFHPEDIFSWTSNESQIKLIRFDYIDDNEILRENSSPSNQLNVSEGCGIYTFKKI